MAAMFEAVSDHWRKCFGREYPLTQEQHVGYFERISAITTEAGKLEDVDHLIAVVGLIGFYSGAIGVGVACGPMHFDRHPKFRSQCEEFVTLAANRGSLAFIGDPPDGWTVDQTE